MAQLLPAVAAQGGVDARQFAACAEVSALSPSASARMIPARLAIRLWELTERALADPYTGPTVTVAPQRPPRSAVLGTVLGTSRIDFDAPAAKSTVRARDFELPRPAADPALTHMLARYAATFPAPPPVTWYERFQQLLDQALAAGRPSLAEMALRFEISTRTVQRRLAGYGTTWRAELDAARRRRAASALLEGGPDGH